MALTQVSPALLNDEAQAQGFKNRIINGDMRIDQRNAGAAVTTNASYAVDRFLSGNNTNGAFSAQQDSSAPAGFTTSVKYTVTTADTDLITTQGLQFRQSIEGTNVADLGWGTANAKTVTLSFWVRSSLTGTFGGSFRNAEQNRSYAFTYSISVADTWEYKTVTVAGDTSGTWLTTNGVGIQVTFGLGAGPDRSGTAGSWASASYVSATGAVPLIGTLNATWYITGVQLEVGSVATEFERRPYGQELALCQRYFQKTYLQTQACIQGANSNMTTSAVAINTGELVSPIISFPVLMRTTPTMTFYRSSGAWNPTDGKWAVYRNGGWDELTDTTYNYLRDGYVSLYFTRSSSFTAGDSHMLIGNYSLSAEL